MRTVAHVTHEAIYKVGGIGAVLEGLLTSTAYRAADLRTVLIGPLFPSPGGAQQRLGPQGEVLYSSLDGVIRHQVGEALNQVRREFHVEIAYGHRTFENPHTGVSIAPEVILIDTSRMSLDRTNIFKAGLWDAFGIDSRRYEHSWEYDLYVKLAQPALACLRALGAVGRPGECLVVAHEWMGLPTALATTFEPDNAFRSVFYAHEVATIRPIVEHHPGHDVTFYNVMRRAAEEHRGVEEIFGSQDHYCRHALVRAAGACDRIFAVGELVAEELRFLGPTMADADIVTTFNGIPAERITGDQRQAARSRLQDYAESLIGDRPDYVFTHVARNLTSKGLWRDFRVLEQLEKDFRRLGRSAVLFVLSTEMPGRAPDDIRRMEEQWGWPLAHRDAEADLSWGESFYYAGVQQFNARSRMIKTVFVNQFGWGRELCGERMAIEMDPLDIRRGSDVEFGQSVYEPFGIAQLEPLTFGAICVLSDACGCAGLVKSVSGGLRSPNVLVAPYIAAGAKLGDDLQWLTLTRKERNELEAAVAVDVAGTLLKRLPTNAAEAESLLESGYDLARRMSWDVIAERFVMPEINEICRVLPAIKVA